MTEHKLPKYGTAAWKTHQYKSQLEAKRGRNYTYTDGSVFDLLEEKGYVLHLEKCHFPTTGQEIVKRLRAEGYFARMYLVASSIWGYPEIYIYKKIRTSDINGR